MRLIRSLLIPCAVVAVVALGRAVAQGDSSAPSAIDPAVQPAARPAQASDFAVFRRPVVAADTLPTLVRRELTPTAQRESLDLNNARAVAPMGTGSVWVLAGTNNVCLAIPDPVDGFGVSCQSIADAEQGKLWVGLNGLLGQRAGDVRIAMLLPDGTGLVTAHGTDGHLTPLPVANNVVVADLSDSQTVDFSDPAGDHSVAIPGTPPALVAGS
jgi:hypothetical protein